MHSAHEMKAHSETQLALLQKQMDEFQNEHEVLIAQLRKKHSDTLHVSSYIMCIITNMILCYCYMVMLGSVRTTR